MAELRAGRAPRAATPATREAEDDLPNEHEQPIGLPEPPPVGAYRAPGRARSRRERPRHRRRHRPRQGHRHRVRPARRGHRARQPQGRAPRRRPRRAGRRSARRSSPSNATSASPTRSPPPSTPPRPSFGLPGVLVNNAAANFPVPAEDMSPNAWRTVVDITLNGTFFCAREFAPPPPRRRHARVDRQHRRVLRVDGRPGLRPLGGGQGRREEHGRDAGRRVGPLRHPGQRARAGPVPARGHDRRHPGQPRPHEREGPTASRRCASAASRSSAGRPRSSRRPTGVSSPATRSWSTARTGSAAA